MVLSGKATGVERMENSRNSGIRRYGSGRVKYGICVLGLLLAYMSGVRSARPLTEALTTEPWRVFQAINRARKPLNEVLLILAFRVPLLVPGLTLTGTPKEASVSLWGLVPPR